MRLRASIGPWRRPTEPTQRSAKLPGPSGDGTREFLRWAAGEGALELDLPPRLLPAPAKKRGGATPVHSEPAAEHEAPIDEWGVNVIGYFRSELGVGEAARQVVRALDAADVSLLPLHGPTVPLSRQDHPYRLRDYTSARSIDLICMNADAVPEFAGHAGPEFFHNRYSIGLWFWEVVDSPADGWHESFRHLEEVWVATAHVAEAVSAVAPVPVTKVTIPIHIHQRGRPRGHGSAGGFCSCSRSTLSVFEQRTLSR